MKCEVRHATAQNDSIFMTRDLMGQKLVHYYICVIIFFLLLQLALFLLFSTVYSKKHLNKSTSELFPLFSSFYNFEYFPHGLFKRKDGQTFLQREN